MTRKSALLRALLLLAVIAFTAQVALATGALLFANSTASPSAHLVSLTSAEKAWIQNHNPIRVGISPVFPPLKFSEKGVIKGVEPDYLQLLAEFTGLKFDLVSCDFSAMDALVKAGKLDMFLSFNIPERRSYMSFTEPFMSFKQVIVTRNDAPFISGISALKGKRIAVVKGVKLYDKLFGPYPDIKIVPVDTMEQMFRAVAEYRADALFTRTLFAGYLIRNFPELKVAGIADLPLEPYHYAVRKDYPELVTILNRAIDAIPKDKTDATIQKWFSLRLEYRPSRAEILKWMAITGGLFIFFLAGSLYWNRKLMKEIKRRRASEDALRESEQRLALVLDGSRQGIWDWNLETGEVIRNERWAEMLGYTLREIEFSVMQWKDLIHPDDRERAWKAINAHLEGKSPTYKCEYRMLCKDGQSVWILDQARIVKTTAAGEPLRMCGTHTDITDSKKAEEEKLALEQQIHQAQKLESLGILAGGIAHDFNNILAVIIGYCGLLKMSPEHVAENVPKIEKAAERAADLVRQMLAYAGKTHSHITCFDMKHLLVNTARMLKMSIPQNAAISFDLPTAIIMFRGDEGQFRQVVMNLIINAAEAIGDAPGEIRVSLGETEIAAGSLVRDHFNKVMPPGRYVCLTVADNGSGMDDETRSKFFEPFFTTKFTGRGLGMAASLGIVTAHKGYLKVISELGKGTTIKVCLPQSADEEKVQSGQPAPWQASGTILLAEDEGQIRSLVTSMLETLGFTVIAAENGREALECYRERAAEISLVITDMGMPLMDGYGLIRELKKLDPQLPIIISSGFGDAEVISRIAPEDIAGIISKPYKLEKLQKVLQTLLQGTQSKEESQRPESG